MRSLDSIEKKETRICEKKIVMESCSQCLFETLCRLEKQRKEREREENWENNEN